MKVANFNNKANIIDNCTPTSAPPSLQVEARHTEQTQEEEIVEGKGSISFLMPTEQINTTTDTKTNKIKRKWQRKTANRRNAKQHREKQPAQQQQASKQQQCKQQQRQLAMPQHRHNQTCRDGSNHQQRLCRSSSRMR